MICKQLKNILTNIPEHVQLVAVSKTKPFKDIEIAYNCNQRDFGENKVQEMLEKHELLPKDIRWHMIGHLQRNKVKYIADFVHLIHGVDNLKLLREIDKQANKNNRIINVLLQIKIAQEETKFGMDENSLIEILQQYDDKIFQNIKIKGFMGMASFTNNNKQIAKEFEYLHKLFISHKEKHTEFEHLSMGMSGDYSIAIEHGSNMIRVGSSIFGKRIYH